VTRISISTPKMFKASDCGQLGRQTADHPWSALRVVKSCRKDCPVVNRPRFGCQPSRASRAYRAYKAYRACGASRASRACRASRVRQARASPAKARREAGLYRYLSPLDSPYRIRQLLPSILCIPVCCAQHAQRPRCCWKPKQQLCFRNGIRHHNLNYLQKKGGEMGKEAQKIGLSSQSDRQKNDRQTG
jgi:hypothetical protein